MMLKIQSIHFDADKKLIDYVESKANKLGTFYDKIIDGEVIMRLENSDNNENKLVEIKLNIPGKKLFVKENARSFEAATDLAIERLKNNLKRVKEKQFVH